MPQDIFGEVIRPSARLGSQAWYTVPVSILAHVGVVALVIVVPLMATDVLPAPTSAITLVVPPPLPPPPPPPASGAPRSSATPAPRSDAAPVTAATDVADPADEPAPPGIPFAAAVDGVPWGEIGGVITAPTPPLPVVKQTPAAPTLVRAGGKIKYPTKLRNVSPVYPRIAQMNRVEGRVIIDAIIGTDGRVKEARILKSVPLLDQAALDAVLQWQFTPTLLNGVPVPVIMTVNIDFRLQ